MNNCSAESDCKSKGNDYKGREEQLQGQRRMITKIGGMTARVEGTSARGAAMKL